MAPKARSSELKLVLGNPGKRRVKKPAAKPAEGPSELPLKWLDHIAKRKYRALRAALMKLGRVTALDADVLAGYCQAYAEWRQATITLQKEGRTFTTEKGYVGAHPAFGQQQAAAKLMRTLGAELGLSPAAAAKMGPPDVKGGDPLSEFLRGH